MSRILAFTSGPEDWKDLLADPDKHWKTGYSARTLAYCWEAADCFPSEISLPFIQSTEPLLENLSPILAIPEFKVPMPGGVSSSQNDIFVLARSSSGPVSIMVEGKVNESFGPTLGDWLYEASSSKKKRLGFLLRSLGLNTVPADSIRYQLLHRSVSAIITGEQYRAVAAVLIVHSFSQVHTGWSDYQAFTYLFGVEAAVGTIQQLSISSSLPLFGVWVVGNPSFLQC
jgi:hypothetical protein